LPAQSFGALFEAWKKAGPDVPFSQLRDVLSRDLADRFVLLRPDVEGG
jgi:hypothetical protein